MDDRFFRWTVVIGVAGIWVLILQNAGLISTSSHSVTVDGSVDVSVTEVQQPVDVNLHSVVGRELVESKDGMDVGVSSSNNTVIPIHWGEISISR